MILLLKILKLAAFSKLAQFELQFISVPWLHGTGSTDGIGLGFSRFLRTVKEKKEAQKKCHKKERREKEKKTIKQAMQAYIDIWL